MRARPYRSRRVAIHLAPAAGSPGAAFVASRKVGGAVARNRARRIMREAWRRVAPAVGRSDAVLVARPDIVGATTDELVEEVEEVLARAGVIE